MEVLIVLLVLAYMAAMFLVLLLIAAVPMAVGFLACLPIAWILRRVDQRPRAGQDIGMKILMALGVVVAESGLLWQLLRLLQRLGWGKAEDLAVVLVGGLAADLGVCLILVLSRVGRRIWTKHVGSHRGPPPPHSSTSAPRQPV